MGLCLMGKIFRDKVLGDCGLIVKGLEIRGLCGEGVQQITFEELGVDGFSVRGLREYGLVYLWVMRLSSYEFGDQGLRDYDLRNWELGGLIV